MDPIHLLNEEIDYELMIRGVFQLAGQQRVKSGRLREILIKESIGILKEPLLGSSPFLPQMDLDVCDGICGEIALILEEDIQSLTNLKECMSRAIHAGNRLQRIVTGDRVLRDKILVSTDIAEALIEKLDGEIKKRTAEIKTKSDRNTVQAASRFSLPMPPNERLLNRPRLSNIIIDETPRHSFRFPTQANKSHSVQKQSEPLPVSLAQPVKCSVGQNSCVETVAQESSIEGGVALPVRTNMAFWENAGSDRQSSLPGAAARMSGSAGDTAEGGERGKLLVQKSLFPNDAVSLAEQMKTVCMIERDMLRQTGVSQTSDFSAIQIPFVVSQPQTVAVTNTGTNAELGNVLIDFCAHEEIEPFKPFDDSDFDNAHSHRNAREVQLAQFFAQNENGGQIPTHSATAPRAAMIMSRRNDNPLSSTQARLTCGTEVTQTYRQPQPSRDMRVFGEEPYRPTVFYTRRLVERERLLPTQNNLYRTYVVNQNAHTYPNNIEYNDNMLNIEFDDAKNMNRFCNNGCENNHLSHNVNNANLNNANNRNFVNPLPYNERFRIKPVPIYQWGVFFSGDSPSGKCEYGIHDFLSQVQMYKESGFVSDGELLNNIGHLLRGSARKWYVNVYRRISTWPQFVQALKGKFLVDDYNFAILSEIEERKQSKLEGVGAYINDMESRFSSMPKKLDEAHQIHIIKKNMLPHLALATATHDIRSISQLEMICKRVESTRVHLFGAQAATGFQNRYKNTPRYANEIEGSSKEIDSSEELEELNDGDEEVNEVRRDRKFEKNNRRFEKKNPASLDKSARRTECFNCLKEGHSFGNCPDERTRIFCFRCGANDVKSPECQKCSRGAEAAIVSDDEAQNSKN